MNDAGHAPTGAERSRNAFGILLVLIMAAAAVTAAILIWPAHPRDQQGRTPGPASTQPPPPAH